MLVNFRHLAKDERSTVTIGMLILMAVLYLGLAAIWNTGSLIDQKMQTQAVADATALSAASELSSGINEMVMLNMLNLRIQGGWNAAFAGLLTATGSFVGFIAAEIYWALRIAAAVGFDLDAVQQAIYTGIDIVRTGAWLGWLIAGTVDIAQTSVEVHYPIIKEALKHIPNNIATRIKQQTEIIDQSVNDVQNVDYEIYVAHPLSELYYPKMAGQPLSYMDVMFVKPSANERIQTSLFRTFFADAQWARRGFADAFRPSAPDDSYKFPVLRLGLVNMIFALINHELPFPFAWGFFDAIMSEAPPGGSVLKNKFFVACTYLVAVLAFGSAGGATLDGRKFVPAYPANANNEYNQQIVVLVKKKNTNQSFMAKNWFKSEAATDSVVAMAQAEAYNPFFRQDKFISFSKNWFDGSGTMMPLRDYSSFGANFQSRLTPIDSELVAKILPNTGKKMNDVLSKKLFGESGTLRPEEVKNVFLH
ncbi:hypothetical protein FACS1894139_05080 [Planctomycetales bacterium]|nr:hypothetical protein FACS1894107_03180 [Planctomycetales bacterium]GHS97066.1 hypothetical protein FACS1894108_02820 [Planctomycetales bacterium]GHT03859.1 hypothetical protein FACS1894139_05080 [Planctomycetales bacterium]